MVGTVRRWLGVRLTTRSPKVGLGSYMAIGYCTNFGSNLLQDGRLVTAQNWVLACSPAQGLSSGWVRLELVRGEVDHPVT